MSRAVAFLPFEDNLVALHGGPALLVDAAHHGLTVPRWSMRAPVTLGEARGMSLRTVVADGAVSGFWEYEPRSRTVAAAMLGSGPARAASAVKAGAEALAAFIADDLGHARSYSLDTDEALSERTVQLATFGRPLVDGSALPVKKSKKTS